MLNWKKAALLCVVSAALLCGCTQSNIVTPETGQTIAGDGQPDLDIDKDIAIDWEEVRNDLRDAFFEPYGPFGDYVLDLDVRYNEDTQTLELVMPVTGNPDDETAIAFAEAALKVVGESISTQNFYYTAPDEDSEDTYYGTFFDDHDVLVQEFPYDKEGDESAYIINDLMKAGEQRAPEIQKQ